jgi:tRNA 5-methylaminomethyl-2-thiouridine biosynthesis bifunctional protein
MDRRAIVIGAGLAGACVTESLARRSWQIDLIERQPQPAQEASGNPAGVILPRIAKDDAISARLSRSAYLYALDKLTELPEVRWAPCGVLQLARDSTHESLQRAGVAASRFPESYVRFLERGESRIHTGRDSPVGGWWFPGGGWISPGSFCNALIARAGVLVTTYFGIEIMSIQRRNDQWLALNMEGREIAAAPHIILANAHAASRLLPHPLPLVSVRGQITYLPIDAINGLNSVVCRSSYVTPPASGTVCIGASFDIGDPDPQPRLRDHVDNLKRLEEMLPGTTPNFDPAALSGRVGFRATTPDRLPLVGTLPDTTMRPNGEPMLRNLPRLSGIHALLGLGARGVVWAPLCAELLACQLEGEALPLEPEMVTAIDAGRFHLRALRRGTAPV